MAKQILVPLKGGDRIEEILFYIEAISRSGMTVVFLVHFGSNRFNELTAQLLTITSGLPADLNADGVPSGFGRNRLSNVEQSIKSVSERLHQRGVAIRIRFYSGSLRRQVRQCIESERIKWLIMRPVQSRILRWCHAVAAALRIAGPSAPRPVFLLFAPNGISRR